MTAWHRTWRILAAIVALAVAWQLAAMTAEASGPSAARLAPTWQHIFLTDLPGFASFDSGTDESDYGKALMVIGSNAASTVLRVVVSIVFAFFIGTALGLVTMSSRFSYNIINPVTRIIRNIPLLALVPLFLIWFGGEEYGIIAFITFGLSMIYLTSTISAIATVDANRIAFARILGAGRATVIWNVILPSIVPSLLDATRVAVGVAFAVGLGGEFLAAQDGLGRLLIVSQTYVLTGRMIIVLICYILLASIAARLVDTVGNRLTQWLPNSRLNAGAV